MLDLWRSSHLQFVLVSRILDVFLVLQVGSALVYTRLCYIMLYDAKALLNLA